MCAAEGKLESEEARAGCSKQLPCLRRQPTGGVLAAVSEIVADETEGRSATPRRSLSGGDLDPGRVDLLVGPPLLGRAGGRRVQ